MTIFVDDPDGLAPALGSALLVELLKRMRQKEPSGEVLAVTRSYLKDCGIGHTSPAEVKQLQALHRLLVKRLREALEAPEYPSASVLSEVRHLLKDSGIGKDLGGARAARQALTELEGATLPFKAPETIQ